MITSTLWFTFLLLATLMATLAWIGWKFFYAPACPASSAQTEPRPARPRLKWSLPSWSFHPTRMLAPLKGRGLVWFFVPILLVGFIVALTLTFSMHFSLDPLTAKGIGPESEVGARLGEEKFLPPPDLPPSMFISTERPNLEGADRDWRHMDSGFTQVVLKLFAKMEQRGYTMALLEGYRSPDRQDSLASKGPSVTNARAFQSKHQYGMAADIAPVRDGKLVISERDPWAATAYKALGEEAEHLGLTWGGRWAMRDLGHVENAAKISTLAKTSTPS
jgi:peptidoglycan LD-endopeptidase CwlK